MLFSTTKELNKIVYLFSDSQNKSCSVQTIRNMKILKFFTFHRSFGKQCFAVVDAPYSKLGFKKFQNNVTAALHAEKGSYKILVRTLCFCNIQKGPWALVLRFKENQKCKTIPIHPLYDFVRTELYNASLSTRHNYH